MWFLTGTIRDCFARNKYLKYLQSNDPQVAEKMTDLDVEIRRYSRRRHRLR